MTRRQLIWILVVFAAGAIFTADTFTPADLSVSVLYVVIIMIVQRTGLRRDLIVAGAGCTFLTTVSYFLSPGGPLQQSAVLIDCGLSLFAILSTSYLSIKIVAMEEMSRQIRGDIAKVSIDVSLSELTASIAHQINQPLAAIVANAGAAGRWLAISPPDLNETRGAVNAILRDAERAGAVVNSLKRLISTTSPEKRAFDLESLLDETLDLMRAEISRSRTNVRLQRPRSLPVMVGDRILIQQVIINIISNALDALKETNAHQREISIDTREQDEFLVLAIKDTGAGIGPGEIDRIFDPFYSTKANGMGIGLAICRSVMDAHGGSIVAYRNDPRGVVVELKMPLVPAN